MSRVIADLMDDFVFYAAADNGTVRLTPRERAVLRRSVAGQTLAQIATALGISARTAAAARTRARNKCRPVVDDLWRRGAPWRPLVRDYPIAPD